MRCGGFQLKIWKRFIFSKADLSTNSQIKSLLTLCFDLTKTCTQLNEVRWNGGYTEVQQVLMSKGSFLAPTLFNHREAQGELLEGLVVFVGSDFFFLFI